MIKIIDFFIDNLYAIKRFLTKPWKRALKLLGQRFTQGFPDSDTWNLDYTIALYTLPRLRRFKELNIGHPPDLTAEKWDEMLDDMIYAMDMVVREDELVLNKEEEIDYDRLQRGLDFFGERFRGLWW